MIRLPTLQHYLDAGEKLVVICLRSGCRHRAVMKPESLASKGVPLDADLAHVGKRMTCEACGGRCATIETYLPPSPPPRWLSAFKSG